MRLKEHHKALLSKMAAGATLYYQPKRPFADAGYFLATEHGWSENVPTRVVNALWNAGYLTRNDQNGLPARGPYPYLLTDEGRKHA